MSDTRTIKVSVTADDIENGNRCDHWGCPIARALWRATGHKWVVGWPGPVDQAYKLGDRAHPVRLPEAAQRFIGEFDTDGYANEFEFELEIP